MPTASVTAPPVRPWSDSCTSFSIATSSLAAAGRGGVAAVQVDLAGLEELGEIAVLRQELGPSGQVDVDVVVHRVGQGRRGDQGDDADQALHQHRAVADHPDVALPVDHLGRRARRDQGVEARDRAAHDADEDIGEDRPVEVRARRPRRSGG